MDWTPTIFTYLNPFSPVLYLCTLSYKPSLFILEIIFQEVLRALLYYYFLATPFCGSFQPCK